MFSPQSVISPSQRSKRHSAPSSSLMHLIRQSPLPGHSTTQSPAHVMSQSPEPVHEIALSSLTATRHSPEPVHETRHPSLHTKSQLPEPAHCRSHASVQSIAQSPVEGQMHSLPLHLQSPVHGPSSHPSAANETTSTTHANHRLAFTDEGALVLEMSYPSQSDAS